MNEKMQQAREEEIASIIKEFHETGNTERARAALAENLTLLITLSHFILNEEEFEVMLLSLRDCYNLHRVTLGHFPDK